MHTLLASITHCAQAAVHRVSLGAARPAVPRLQLAVPKISLPPLPRAHAHEDERRRLRRHIAHVTSSLVHKLKTTISQARGPRFGTKNVARRRWPTFARRWTSKKHGATGSSDPNNKSWRFSGPEAKAKALAQQGQDYQRALDVRAAVQSYEAAVALLPGSSHYLSMLAKQQSDVSYLKGVTAREMRETNERAIATAERAIAADPRNSMAHVAACVSKGRLALCSDTKAKVRLAKEAQSDAYTALATDPNSDLAHHLMGRWHYEMANINCVVRACVRVMFGTALNPGTHQDALASYQQAVRLNPSRLIHRVEAGRLYLKLGDKAAAQRELEEALRLEVEDLNAHWTRIDAQDMLAKLRREAKGGWGLPTFHTGGAGGSSAQHQGGGQAPCPA